MGEIDGETSVSENPNFASGEICYPSCNFTVGLNWNLDLFVGCILPGLI